MFSREIKVFLYKAVSVLIFGGLLMMIQPFSMTVYTYGFPVILAGVIIFNIVDHIPARPTIEE